jgi:hypothetical protein
MLGSLTAVLTLLAVALYLLPVLVGVARRVPDIGSVAVINVLLGWTLVGWVLALALAMRSAQPGTQDRPDLKPVPPHPARPPAIWPGPPGPLPPRPGPPPLTLPPRPENPQDPSDQE